MVEEKTAGRPIGATGDAVAKNIRRIRDSKGISGPELSVKLADLGRPIPPLGIHRIETGKRRVDVDDLVAFALALDVSPTTLLMPDYESLNRDDLVDVTGQTEPVEARRLWDWLRAEQTLTDSYSDMPAYFAFIMAASPRWIRERREELLREDMERVTEALRREALDGNN